MIATLNIAYNREAFDPSELVLVDKAIQNGHYDHLAALIVEVTPEKAKEIEKIQKQLRPKAFTFESQAQKEAEIWMATHMNELTPEKEAEFQKLIDSEKQEKLLQLTGGVVENQSSSLEGTNKTQVALSNTLSDVKGLGQKSIDRLQAASILTVDDLRKLSQADRIKILGPLVADKIKNLT
jgi:predicted flap endonuclease-1-like 5' DNA nuclease